MNTLVGHHFTRTLVKAGPRPRRAARADGTTASRPDGRSGPPDSGSGDRPEPLEGGSAGRRYPRTRSSRRAASADLPTGQEKTAPVRSMFDAIAPRYDLVNRMMTFGLDLRWRRQVGPGARGCPPGSRVLDLACGTGDFLAILRRPDCRRSAWTCRGACCAANRTGRPWPRPTAPRCRWPAGRWTGSPAATPCATSPISRRSSASSAGWCGPEAASASSRWPNPNDGPLRAGHRIWFRRVVPLIGGLVSDRAAYRYLPESDRLPPAHGRAPLDADDAGFSAVNRRPLSGGLSQLITATRAGRP